MIRLLMVLIVVAPWTIYLTLEILWHVYRKSPDRQRIFEAAPRRWSALLLKAAGVRVVTENPPEMPLERPLVVVANQVVDTWSEGHLLAAWIVLWTVAFAAIALLATPVRSAGRVLGARWERLAEARRQARADREYWDIALTDPRLHSR